MAYPEPLDYPLTIDAVNETIAKHQPVKKEWTTAPVCHECEDAYFPCAYFTNATVVRHVLETYRR